MARYKIRGLGKKTAHRDSYHLIGAIIETKDCKHIGGGYYQLTADIITCPKAPYLDGRYLCCNSAKLRKLEA